MFRANFGRFQPTHAILLEVFLEISWPELPHAAKIKNSSHEFTNIKFFENRQHEIIICLCYCWILNKLIFTFILNKKKHTWLHLLAQNMIGVPYGVAFFNDVKNKVTRTFQIHRTCSEKLHKNFVEALKKSFQLKSQSKNDSPILRIFYDSGWHILSHDWCSEPILVNFNLQMRFY